MKVYNTSIEDRRQYLNTIFHRHNETDKAWILYEYLSDFDLISPITINICIKDNQGTLENIKAFLENRYVDKKNIRPCLKVLISKINMDKRVVFNSIDAEKYKVLDCFASIYTRQMIIDYIKDVNKKGSFIDNRIITNLAEMEDSVDIYLNEIKDCAINYKTLYIITKGFTVSLTKELRDKILNDIETAKANRYPHRDFIVFTDVLAEYLGVEYEEEEEPTSIPFIRNRLIAGIVDGFEPKYFIEKLTKSVRHSFFHNVPSEAYIQDIFRNNKNLIEEFNSVFIDFYDGHF